MKKEYIYAIISVLLWSTTATATKLLLGNLDSMQILLLGSLFAVIFLSYYDCDFCLFDFKRKNNYKNNNSNYTIAFTSWALALEKGDTARISNIAYITPFISLVWTSVMLKEKLSMYSIIGLIIIVLGIFIQMKNNKKDV